MVINIPTDKNKIFKQYLNIINPILGKNKLTTSEIEVFSKFLLIKSLYNNLSEEDIQTICFHADTKKKIRENIKEESKINLSEASFNNILLSLRKKGFIKDKKINSIPGYGPKGISLTFNLNLDVNS